MPRSGDFAVKVEGLAELRRDLRRLEPAALKEIQGTLKGAVNVVAREAALLAPRRTGEYAASFRPYTRGNRAGVRSTWPGAGVHEYGGTIRPRGTPILIRRSAPITRAAERQMDTVVQELGDGIEQAARSTGWH